MAPRGWYAAGMGIIARLLGSGQKAADNGSEEHAVIVSITLADQWPSDQEREELHALQDDLGAAIDAADAGEFDGDEWGEGACTIYMYGPSADHLWEAIAPVLEKRPFPKGSYARRRYGPPGTREDRVDLMWAGA